MRKRLTGLGLAALSLLAIPNPTMTSAIGQFVSSDTYTRYELLAPESHQFKIYYEVTETKPGAKYHFNAIREGAEASDESVIDLASGKPLKFEVVTGAQAAEASGDKSNRCAMKRVMRAWIWSNSRQEEG